ncbi:MAG: hypothetical protein AAGC81_02395 [Pseudomonadota bacterium]
MTTERITRYVRVVVDASGSKSGGREVQRALNDINRSAKRTAAAMDGLKRAFVGAFAGVGIAQGVRAIIGGAAQAEQQFSRLAAQIANTGGVAGRSLQDIEALAQEIGINTLASTQQVRDSASSLLTFRNVAGSVFDDTLRLSQDLAESGIGSLQSNVIQLGKALNDPTKGLSALSRSGVTFTKAQEDMIKGLVRSGDLLTAQTLIIEELKAQVEGAGVAAAQGFNGALDTLIERAKLFGEAFGGQALNPLAGFLRGLAGALGFITNNLDVFNGAIVGVATLAIPKLIVGVKALTVALATNPFGALITAAAVLGGSIGRLLGLNVQFGESTASVGQIVRTVWSDLSGVVGTFFSDVFGWIGTFLSDFGQIGDEGGRVFQFLIDAGRSWLNTAIAVFKSVVDFSVGAFSAMAQAGRALWRGLSSGAASFAKAAKAALKLDFAGAQAALDANEGFDFSGVAASVSASASIIGENFATDFVGAASGGIESYLSSVTERAAASTGDTGTGPTFNFGNTEGGTTLGGGGGGAGGGGGGGITSPTAGLADDTSAETWAERTNAALSSVGSTFDKLAGITKDSLGEQSAAYKAAFAVTKATALATAIVNTAQAVTEALKLPPPAGQIQAGLAAAAGAAEIATITASAISGFQSGGFTGNGAKDEVSGVVHGQEFVMNSEATRRNRPALEAMNAGREPAGGGNVKVVVVDDRQKVGDYLQSSEGERIVMAHVGANG